MRNKTLLQQWGGGQLLAAVCLWLVTSALSGVEGAGSYRGNAILVPYFRNTAQELTFIRLARSFSGGEDSSGAPANARVHVTWQVASNDGTRCLEQNGFLTMTRQDLYFLNGRSERGAPAPQGEGFMVAWMSGSAENHLSGDMVTVDVANGAAWGANALAFRAPPGGGGGFLDGVSLEAARIPTTHYVTVLAHDANIQGARTPGSGTRYVIVPLSYMTVQAGTALVPEVLGPGNAYANHYSFDILLFDSDENRLSLSSRTIRCWDILSASQILGGPGRSFLSGPSGSENSQGWMQFDGRGLQNLSRLGAPGTFEYDNRAVVLQVDSLSLGGDRVSWAFWSAHDRTTAEIDPNPAIANAAGSGGAARTDPDATPTFP